MPFTETEILGNVGAELDKLNDSEAKRRIIRYYADKYNVKLAGGSSSSTSGRGSLQGFGEDEEDGDVIIQHESIFGPERVNVSAAERRAAKSR